MGSRHHWIPATYIARFSSDTKPSRKSRVHVYSFKDDRTFVAGVTKVAAAWDYYTLRSETEAPDALEQMWARYETRLSPALDNLVSGELDAVEWLHTIVPFVAGLLVRGPDFAEAEESRLLATYGQDFVGKFVGPDNTHGIRERSLQMFMSALVFGRWVVAQTTDDAAIVLNERGWLPCHIPTSSFDGSIVPTPAIGVPLSGSHLLCICPQRVGPLLAMREGRWHPIIERMVFAPGAARQLLMGAAATASRFLFGPTRASVTLDDEALKSAAAFSEKMIVEPWHLQGFPRWHELVAHELAWHRLAAAMTHAPEQGHWDFALDLDRLVASRRWIPRTLVFPIGNPILPPPFLREGEIIYGQLYAVPGITSPPDRERLGETYRYESFRFDNRQPYPFLYAVGNDSPRWPRLAGHRWHPETILREVEQGSGDDDDPRPVRPTAK